MDVFRKRFSRLGTDDRLPANYKETYLKEFGSDTSEQKRAPFTEEDWTCENESYRFPIDKSPKDPLKQCFEMVDKADEELYQELKDEISWLLIVASLFLAIVTAFSITSFGWLRIDDAKVSTALLGDIVKLLNDTDARGTAPPRDATNLNFHPRDSEILVNQLWFLSMTLSLSAVVIGTHCFQWLSTFRRKELKPRTYDDALALRQLRFDGLVRWGVPRIPSVLLLAVQGTFVLFAAGLIILLWSVNKRVAIPVAIVGGMAALFLTITAVLPLLQSIAGWIFPSTLTIPQCPYKSPISWVIHRSFVLLSIVITSPFGKISGSKRRLLTDYTWKAFDDLWRNKREDWGPQASKTESSNRSYYFVRGLGSAMEMLAFQPDAFHIIHTYLQKFYGTIAGQEMFQDLFGKDTAAVKELFREYASLPCPMRNNKSQSQHRPSMSHKKILIRDFLNALVLQRFTFRNPKLHQALLPHLVELYIRINNSSRIFRLLPPGGGETQPSLLIDTSTECPIRNMQDAESLPSELRHQFLSFAYWFLETDRCKKSDVVGIKYVLEASEKLPTICDAQVDDADEPPFEARVKRVLKLLDEHLTEKSHHGRQWGRASTAPEFTTGEANGEPPDRKFDRAHNDPAGSSVLADKCSFAIPEDSSEVVRCKLEKYKQRTKTKKVDRNLTTKTLLPL